MKDSTVSFRFGSISFNDLSELETENREKVKHNFQLWERKIRICAGVHFLGHALDIDSSKAINVTVETKKESPTSNG